jgi:hypothetical protein
MAGRPKVAKWSPPKTLTIILRYTCLTRTPPIARGRDLGASPGGDIMVHGLHNGIGWLGSLHLAINWTDVTNSQIEEIWSLVGATPRLKSSHNGGDSGILAAKNRT